MGGFSGCGIWNSENWDVCACRVATIDQIEKQMAREDSAHRVGPTRYPLCLADCSGSISMEGFSDCGILDSENWCCLGLWYHNKPSDRKMDGAMRFGALNSPRARFQWPG